MRANENQSTGAKGRETERKPEREKALRSTHVLCWSKKESVRIPSLRRFGISREQDREVLGFIPVYVDRFMEHIPAAISKA
jgi:hypothetical protein